MIKTLRTSVETLCLGDTLLVDGAWEKVVAIDSPREDISETFVVTDKSHTLGIQRGAMLSIMI